MTQTVCFTRSDLSLLRRFGAGPATSWTATPIPEGDHDTARPMLDRVKSAASWIASAPGRKRLDRVVIDVDESVCYMVRSPSLARPVLAASARSSGQDWGDLAPVAGLEPLTDPIVKQSRKNKNAENAPPLRDESEGVSVAVISQTDALTRLWLDTLDARGVRSDNICSLWHAAAQSWGHASGTEISLILLCEHERIVWTMARGEDLLCGASAAVGSTPAAPSPTAEDAPPAPEQRPADPLRAAIRRCTLDWLTWSSQLGLTPDRVVIVGPAAKSIAEMLPEAWRALGVETHVDSDPIAVTCTRLSQKPAESVPTSRRSLVRLSGRPTRATRWRYGWSAASLVLFGLALGALGYRFSGAANDAVAAAGKLREEMNIRVKEILPAVDPLTNVVLQLDSEVARQKQTAPFAAPQPPPKIFDEFVRICDALAKFPGTKIRSVVLASERASLTCTVADRPTNELLQAALKDGGAMTWTAPSNAGSTDFTTLTLSGEWRK